MDKKLFKNLASAVEDALAFERGEQIELRVTALPLPKPRRARKAIRLRKKRMKRQASA